MHKTVHNIVLFLDVLHYSCGTLPHLISQRGYRNHLFLPTLNY